MEFCADCTAPAAACLSLSAHYYRHRMRHERSYRTSAQVINSLRELLIVSASYFDTILL